MATTSTQHRTEQLKLLPFTEFATVSSDTRLEDLNLNWKESDLPERDRTKHVHRLHPYLGKFVPQLVEIFLRKYRPRMVVDPFCGSGTTLVEALALGINGFGVDSSEFNGLLTQVKITDYDIDVMESEVRDILAHSTDEVRKKPRRPLLRRRAPHAEKGYLKEWFAEPALEDLLNYRSLIPQYRYHGLLRIILSRAARSARLTPHFDLDFPKAPKRNRTIATNTAGYAVPPRGPGSSWSGIATIPSNVYVSLPASGSL